MKNKILVLKSLFIVCFIVFCCTESYAKKKEPIISIKISGGQIIKEGNDKGLIGYNSVRYRQWETDGIAIISIQCASKGFNPCSKPTTTSGLTPVLYDEITARLHNAISMGESAGEFVHEGFLCTWKNGRKKKKQMKMECLSLFIKLI